MGYIYEATDRSKDTTVKIFSNQEELYKTTFKIIVHRRELQLYQPLHYTGRGRARRSLSLRRSTRSGISCIFGKFPRELGESTRELDELYWESPISVDKERLGELEGVSRVDSGHRCFSYHPKVR
uniref:Uncharacterized protein n=1 Tax=Lactuca sativa TaxID=4236 RepID=A0A9R1X248_LACSA|nr:hypothetical protein LSAT_V11C700387980 [Lactuca sativa]